MTYDPQDLTGDYIRLWPFSLDVHGQEPLLKLLAMLQESNAAYRVFWAYAKEPLQDTVDVAFYLEYMKKTILLVAQDLVDGEIVGVCWFDDIQEEQRANYNMWFKRRAWGIKSRQAGRLAHTYGHKYFGFKQIWGFTPWRDAMRHGEALGGKVIATLPRYARVRGELRDVYVLLREME